MGTHVISPLPIVLYYRRLGYTGSSHSGHSGGASNHVCLPLHPTGSRHDDRSEFVALMFTTVYASAPNTATFGSSLVHHNAPCAVCRSTSRSSAMMLPGRDTCYTGWHSEYHGYLMSGSAMEQATSEFICVDGAPESVHQNVTRSPIGGRLFVVEIDCSGSSTVLCQQYVHGREMACSVCTK
jgi:hypothetical protein